MPTSTVSKRRRPAARRGREWTGARRAELLDAADRAIRREGPMVSMDDIAAEASISRVVLYRYFGDKSGLYEAVADRYIADLMSRLRAALEGTSDPQARLASTIETYVAFIETNREQYDFLMHRAVREGPAVQTTVADFMGSVAGEIGKILAEEIAERGFDPSPAAVWASGVVGMVHLATDRWLETGDMPRDAFVASLVGLLGFGFFGLAGDPTLAEGAGLERR